MDWIYIQLLGRMVLINIVPFFLVFHLVMKRRDQFKGKGHSDLKLIAKEIQIVGLLGYYVILSIFFFSIPVLQYLNTKPGYNIILVKPDDYTVFLISFISFALVVSSVYLKNKRFWAYQLSFFIITGLLVYSFFSILEWGLISIVPVTVFAYLMYRLKNPLLRRELRVKERS